MPNPMTGAGYGNDKPKPKSPFSPAKPTDTSKLGFSKDYGKTDPSKGKKKIKMGNVTTYEGSLYQKRQEAFLKKMQEMNKRNAPKN
jgi:hypothetical protein